jgi:UDP-N-acetylglucosamine 3-dehydrogenase
MIKLGVIGLGSMGKNHVRVCSQLGNIELIGVCDINKKIAKNVGDSFQISHYSHYSELLPKIDAAIIATPTISHYNIGIDLLKKGKHLLIEKPICNDEKNADKLVELAKKENLTLAVGHIERYNPVVSLVKELINKNQLGELISIKSKRVSKFPGRIKDVGVILDFGVHDIDIMRYLAGEVISVYATAAKFNKKIDFEDHADIMLTFDSGISGVIEVNWLTPIKIRKLNLTCSKKFVEIDYIQQSVCISSSTIANVDENNLYNVPIQNHKNYISLERKDPLMNEIEDFVSSIKSATPPLVTGYDGLQAIRIANAANRSYKNKEVIRLK